LALPVALERVQEHAGNLQFLRDAGIVEQIQDALNPVLMLRLDALGLATGKKPLQTFVLKVSDYA
jgi:hypothetical protein